MERLISFVIMWIVSTFCCQYTIMCCFAKDLPWYIDAFAGLLIPVWVMGAILSKIATLCDVITPFFV